MSIWSGLVADIGGTNTRVALARGAEVDPGSVARFRNADHSGLTEVLRHYLADRNARPAAASVSLISAMRIFWI